VPAPPHAVAGSKGGLVFRASSRRYFLAAEFAVKVVPYPQVVRLPGAPPGLLGLALSEGVIVPIIELGPARTAMIVCVHRDEAIGLVGVADIVSGMFASDGGTGVLVSSELVTPLDVEAIYERVHGASWGAHWSG
jgi:hypothetical protein